MNPAGGAGKAHRLVMEFVIGVWSEAQFSHKIIVTGRKCLDAWTALIIHHTKYILLI